MCTLSWQIDSRKNCLHLAFNRDELFSREEAIPPAFKCDEGVRWMAPTDPQGGGTWIAANESGMVLCLLNDYMGKSVQNLRDKAKSRGLLVKKLITKKTSEEIRSYLTKEKAAVYQPFNLVLFPGVANPVVWHWDGEMLSEINNPDMPLVSSGIRQSEIQQARKAVFTEAAAKQPESFLNRNELLRIHRQEAPLPQPVSIAMRLKDRGTVSITTIKICEEGRDISMYYYPGNPLEARGQSTGLSLHRLQE